MEPTEVKKRGRGRPRKRRREEDDTDKKLDLALKKQALEMRWKPLVGRYVLKEFDETGVFLGKIVSYDTGLYRVEYEDGDCEDMDSREIRQLLLGDDYFDDDLTERSKKLDQVLFEKSLQNKKNLEKGTADVKKEKDRLETSALTELSAEAAVENDGAEDEGNADSSSDSCEQVQHGDSELEFDASLIPPLQLPPSSGNVGVPEECVSHLFSVYGFLRSFNICLFLSPFTLDDLVGAINCKVQNTLLDAIHVALLRALRGHLQSLASDGSELASKCLRCIDWNLLDMLTWPVYLVHYFTIMGHVERLQWKGFYDDLFMREYYSLSVSRKLTILQILCDDALDCQELRAEIDLREESEVGTDSDALSVNLIENGPRRVHPRYSKTSACKDREAMEIIAETQGTKSSYGLDHLGSRGQEEGGILPDVSVDGNSDECRLCGMDGTLLCCDGCPSAYHSRCIGVVKMYIPEGPWYCSECTISKLGPTNVVGTSLKGAELFGVDLHEQVFLGSCNHLLVLKSSTGTEPCMRYYSEKDIPNVLQVLSSSAQHGAYYLEICKAIAEYWKIPESVFTPFDNMDKGLFMSSLNDVPSSTLSIPSRFSENLKVTCVSEAETAISQNVDSVNSVSVSSYDASATATTQADRCAPLTELPEHVKVESTGSINQRIDPSDVLRHSSIDRSAATCTSANTNGFYSVQESATCLPAVLLSQRKELNHRGLKTAERNSKDDFLYVGTFFKPFAYINHYMHGDFSASAAASLAVLLSEESRVSETQKSSSAKKGVSDIALQVKAFSNVASRFFWPSSEKKLIEVPRERCGWCHSCKLSGSKRGCMLNSAALTATKGAMKIINGLRPITSGGGSLPSIATYILYMGEVLCGLTVGPFASLSYRKQWCKRVDEASTFSALKSPLLEMEENIREVTFSPEWVKATDEWLFDSPAAASAASIVGTTQKRGPGGRRHRKQSGLSDIRANSSNDKSFVWWRGGKLLKLLFHKAVLPQVVVKRAARQGGSRRISGVYYDDDPVHPKRSRQMVWRAAVERSKNASQLALQVRYLDLHVRWSDLVRPEQNLHDGKGPETEASFFRNAVICDKRSVESKIRYGVAFGNQKHLPSRIMKNMIEIEKTEDGKEKYWFSETHVPLYLIKEYEEKVEKVVLPSLKGPLSELSELQRRQLKAARKDIFIYLTYKRDKAERCSCACCKRDVLLRDTVKCSACQGYCHKDCTVDSAKTNALVEFTCKKCRKPEIVTLVKNGSLTTPLALQGREPLNLSTVPKKIKFKLSKPLEPPKMQETSSEKKQVTPASSSSTKARSKIAHWGVIWRKKPEENGIDFRRNNVLLSGDARGIQPVCNLCKKEYNSELIYIHCGACNGWFHAEALELDEMKIENVVGFKCCRCRRIKSPKCPYGDDPHGQLTVSIKSSATTLKKVKPETSMIADFDECKLPPPQMDYVEEVNQQDNDPLLFSLSRVEQITEQTPKAEIQWDESLQGPHKLPVRRQGKLQPNMNGTFEGQPAEFFVPAQNDLMISKDELTSTLEWDVSANVQENEGPFDYDVSYEDMEFEPQTYFTFTELLDTDDGQLEGDAPGDVLGYSENQLGFTDASGNGWGYSGDQSFAVSQDGYFDNQEQLVTETADQSGAVVAPESVAVSQCKMCSHTEPVPDLTCVSCKLLIHSHCSPWIESWSPGGSWRCGNCKEWR